jgi:plastocyanin
MDNRARSLAAFATVTILAWFVLAACASSAGPGRTYVPPAATPQSSGAPAGGGIANEIDLVETASLQITNPAGQPVTTITVRRGQTYHFKITNTAGFVHNFYIGKVSDLEADNLAKLTGVGDFSSGTKEFDYTFSDTSAPLGFGCMVPGHYQAGMKGTFTVQ